MEILNLSAMPIKPGIGQPTLCSSGNICNVKELNSLPRSSISHFGVPHNVVVHCSSGRVIKPKLFSGHRCPHLQFGTLTFPGQASHSYLVKPCQVKSEDSEGTLSGESIIINKQTLEQELQNAIEEENYAQAAKIRDSLRNLQEDSKASVLASHALPQQYRKLMTDPNSPIIDFYPTDFEVDMNGKRFAWQGIAKLPFIDEARLLAEVEKVEHTLTDEEVRRNSTMCDMFFVALSHPLSPYIFSLNDRCKQLTDEERTQVKEQLDPRASGGMNGYISLCGGDPCPPIFRSPVEGMEDIMDNQVICAIYRLPDAHKHITQPPPGVKPPKKTVTVGDLTPEPVLWHEDSGRKPWENRRHNSQGSISGPHLGDAAHRLVANSLQAKTERNGYGDQYAQPPSYAPSRGPPYHSYQNNRHQGREQYRMAPPNAAHLAHSSEGHHNLPNSVPVQNQFDHSYGQPYAPSATRNPQSRNRPPLERSELPVDQSRDYPTHGHYAPRLHQNGYVYQPRGPHHVAQTPPIPAGAQFYQQGGYNNRGSFQSYGATNYHHQSGGGGRAPPANPNQSRGYGRPQQFGNTFSALDRGTSRRPPPPPGYRR